MFFLVKIFETLDLFQPKCVLDHMNVFAFCMCHFKDKLNITAGPKICWESQKQGYVSSNYYHPFVFTLSAEKLRKSNKQSTSSQ